MPIFTYFNFNSKRIPAAISYKQKKRLTYSKSFLIFIMSNIYISDLSLKEFPYHDVDAGCGEDFLPGAAGGM